MNIKQNLFFLLTFLLILSCNKDDNTTIGNSQNNPINPQNSQPERFISLTGGATTIGIKQNGTLWAWGKNVSGQMGNGLTSDYYYSFLPSKIGTDTNWKTVDYSGSSVIGIKTDGSLWRWGTVVDLTNLQNQFIAFPTRIGNDNDWKKVVGTSAYYIGIKENGSLWGWGLDSYIGFGNSSNYHLLPILLNNGVWKEIAGGSNNSIALKNDGTLWSLGHNNCGQLGNGTQNFSSYTLTQIGTASDWIYISASGDSCFAIKANGTLWAWGRNVYGQLGLGNTIDVFSPTQVGIAADWSIVSTSGSNSVFLKNDGTIWGCGLYMKKFIGSTLNSITETYSLVKLDNRNDWNSVISADGAIYARKTNLDYWGIGYSYALGIANSDFYNLQMTPMTWN